MKTLLLTALTISFLVIPLRAQQASTFVQATGGLTMSIAPEDAASYYPTGFILGVSGLRMLRAGYGLEAGVSYSVTPLDSGQLLQDLGLGNLNVRVEGGAMSILSAFVGLRYQFDLESRNIPYFHAQGGIRQVNFNEGSVTGGTGSAPLEKETETRPGMTLGAGLRFPVGPAVDLLGEVNYDVIFTDEDPIHVVPVTFGVVYALD